MGRRKANQRPVGRPAHPCPDAAKLLRDEVQKALPGITYTDEDAGFSSMLTTRRPGQNCRVRWQQQQMALQQGTGIVVARVKRWRQLDRATVQQLLAQDTAAADAATDAQRRGQPVQCGLPASASFRFRYNTLPCTVGCVSGYLVDQLESLLAVVLRGAKKLYVFRELPGGQLVPWVVVAPSAALARLQDPQVGLGVYAWQPFPARSLLGVYVGEVLGPVACTQLQRMVECDLHGSRYNAILEVAGQYVDGRRSPWGADGNGIRGLGLQACSAGQLHGHPLFDPQQLTWPGMCAHLMNDARGAKGHHNNVEVLEPSGVVRTVRDVPVYDFDLSPEENARSELLWPYAGRFWQPR